MMGEAIEVRSALRTILEKAVPPCGTGSFLQLIKGGHPHPAQAAGNYFRLTSGNIREISLGPAEDEDAGKK